MRRRTVVPRIDRRCVPDVGHQCRALWETLPERPEADSSLIDRFAVGRVSRGERLLEALLPVTRFRQCLSRLALARRWIEYEPRQAGARVGQLARQLPRLRVGRRRRGPLPPRHLVEHECPGSDDGIPQRFDVGLRSRLGAAHQEDGEILTAGPLLRVEQGLAFGQGRRGRAEMFAGHALGL